MKIKGITTGTYLDKRLKSKSKKEKISKKEICSKCKYSDICKYKNISKFENGKVFKNNVECDNFYFIISSKAVLNAGRDVTTGKTITMTFAGSNEEEALNKALAHKIELDKNGGRKYIEMRCNK